MGLPAQVSDACEQVHATFSVDDFSGSSQVLVLCHTYLALLILIHIDEVNDNLRDHDLDESPSIFDLL